MSSSVLLRTNPSNCEGVVVAGEVSAEGAKILSQDALTFLAALHRHFEPRRRELLVRRIETQGKLDAGKLPGFLQETREIRESDWTVAKLPPDLLDRRVEITGPVDRKMIINALNSGATVFMADFEDSNSPTWANCVEGQVNLRDAVARTIAFTKPDGTRYALKGETATLFVRPRGWHLDERHLLVDDEVMSASLFDFGLFFFHNATKLIERGTGPYFYLPKLENHLEARLWNDVFVYAQETLGVSKGSIRATVLIENILAVFEMDEILWELREHSAGLNCGRWDYIFSVIKKFRKRTEFVLPDRGQLVMDSAFLKAYSELLIRTCHGRGAHAMGGMAPQVPIKNDSAANASAMESVRSDKLREVAAGHDGTWVAHPALVPIARMVFDQHMTDLNQIHRLRDDVEVSENDLLEMPSGQMTEAGLRRNIRVSVHYLAAWLSGNGCVLIGHLMEDAATAEISRSQVWQWISYAVCTEDGVTVTADRVRQILGEETEQLVRNGVGGALGPDCIEQSARLFEQMVTAPVLDDWLTVTAQQFID